LDADVTRKFITDHKIVALKADKTKDSPEIDALLVRLGNRAKAIPFYAIYPAGRPEKPILLDGVFVGPGRIAKALEQAVDISSSQESVTVPTETSESGGG